MYNNIIYRIEWKDVVSEKKWGVGIFRFAKAWYPENAISDNIVKEHSLIMTKYNDSKLIKQLKAPYSDFDLYHKEISNYVFGFTSITALKKCLGTRHLNNFLKLGFVVKKYEKYSDYHKSYSELQCIFIPTKEGEIIDIKAISPVYRIEHVKEREEGIFNINPHVYKGIYRDMFSLSAANHELNNMFSKHNQGNTYPCGSQDFGHMIKSEGVTKIVEKVGILFEKFFYGFSSTKQVTQWFTKKELSEMKKEGYVLKEFTKYENVLNGKSNKQIIFIPKSKGVVV